MRLTRSIVFAATIVASSITGLVACQDDSTSNVEPISNPTSEAGADDGSFTPADDAGADKGVNETDAGTDAGKVLEDGLIDPVPYTSRADSPFEGVAFGSYFHFEDWEDDMLDTPGVTASSDQLGTAFGTSLVDSIDGDDGVVDGKCAKPAGTCNSAFGNGTIEFTFDAMVLGALPTHVGIAWTDGAKDCDAIFEAFDANDVSLGTKIATAVGDDDNTGGVAEDRFFAVVHSAGVKRIVVKSSSGGVEVDHLTYGR